MTEPCEHLRSSLSADIIVGGLLNVTVGSSRALLVRQLRVLIHCFDDVTGIQPGAKPSTFFVTCKDLSIENALPG